MVKKVTNAPEPNSWRTDLGTNLIVLLDVFLPYMALSATPGCYIK